MSTDEKKKSQNRQNKEGLVAEISKKVEKANAMVFTNYQGMTHKQLEELKKGLKAANAELVVTKNTLLKIAVGDKAKDLQLDQPTATLFAYNDPIAPLKELAKSIKALKLPSIKLAIFEGKVITEQDVLKLSTLPSKDVLLAQLVGNLKGPLFGLHRALNWNMQKLVMTLKSVEQKKGGEQK